MKKASENFTLDYQIINATQANPSIRINLTLTGVSTSAWAVNKNGVYLALGFGGKLMSNIDFNLCQYTYTNKTTDAFFCIDSYFDANR